MHSETTSIPTNPRTTRPVGYAFVDLSTADEAQKAITELSGKQILDRKVSVQLARKPETAAEKQAAATANGAEGADGGAENGRRRNSGRGRGGRARGRGGRGARGGRVRALPCLCDTQTDETFCSAEPKALKARAQPMPMAKQRLLRMSPTTTKLLRMAQIISRAGPVNHANVDPLKTAFHPKLRLWLPTYHTTSVRRRCVDVDSVRQKYQLTFKS